jgi:hypothetical protein
VYEGQRAADPNKRVFILTRSAFAGMQRNAAAAWSGDIHPRWFEFRKQIPAGLNFALSGLPYWTTDIGGFTDANIKDPAYQELFVRWFQYGTFCPVFRVHGTRIPDENELWSYGPKAQAILTDFDALRYRLMPYIYSLAWRTTHEGYTIMRPLVMDFQDDERAREIGDQFLFGPAILVNPRSTFVISIFHPLPGTTSGLALPSRALAPSMRPRRSSVCRFSCAPGRFFRSDRTCNMLPRSRPIRSRFASIAVPAEASRSTKMRMTITTTRRVRTRPFLFLGTRQQRRLRLASARAISRACFSRAPSTSCL